MVPKVFEPLKFYCIGTDRSELIVQTQIRLKEQSEQGLHCLISVLRTHHCIVKNCSSLRAAALTMSGVSIFRIFIERKYGKCLFLLLISLFVPVSVA